MIPVAERVEQHLAQRKAFGAGLSPGAVRELKAFAAFAANGDAGRVTTALFLDWKDQRPGAASRQTWSYRLSHVRAFARWLKSLEPRTEVPPHGLIRRNRKRPQPHIHTDEELADIVAAASRLPSSLGLRGPTCATLFGLLAVTGLRIGEAVGLDDGDVDTREAVLQVRHAKNNRRRTVPITACAAGRLVGYRSLRDRIVRAPETRRSSGGSADMESGSPRRNAASPGSARRLACGNGSRPAVAARVPACMTCATPWRFAHSSTGTGPASTRIARCTS